MPIFVTGSPTNSRFSSEKCEKTYKSRKMRTRKNAKFAKDGDLDAKNYSLSQKISSPRGDWELFLNTYNIKRLICKLDTAKTIRKNKLYFFHLSENSSKLGSEPTTFGYNSNALLVELSKCHTKQHNIHSSFRAYFCLHGKIITYLNHLQTVWLLLNL